MFALSKLLQHFENDGVILSVKRFEMPLEYIACQLQLNEFDNVPKLKSVTSRPHQNGIAAEELESIQLALEDQLSWAVRRKKFLQDNLDALQEDPQTVTVNATSTFPYLGLDSNSALLGPNCGTNRTVPVGSPKIDSTSRFPPYITSPSSSLSSSRGGPRKDNQPSPSNAPPTVPVSSSYASISPVENLSKTKSEVPQQFWKHVDEVYCCKISAENLKKTLLPICNNYEDSELSKFFEVPSIGEGVQNDRESNSSSNGSISGSLNDVNGTAEENGVSPCKRAKTSTNRKESINSKKKQLSKTTKLECVGNTTEFCSIGPLTQLLISSLIHPSNAQVSKLYNFGVAETDVNISNVAAAVFPKMDGAKDTWLRNREECRLENIARKELKKLGFLDSVDGNSVGEEEDAQDSRQSRIMPTVRVDCTDEVLCALRSKQCELDILVDANKVGLKNLYSKCQQRLTQQQLEEKADQLDSKIKDQYGKLLQCKASKRLLSKKEQDHMNKLLEEWKSVYLQLNLLR